MKKPANSKAAAGRLGFTLSIMWSRFKMLETLRAEARLLY